MIVRQVDTPSDVSPTSIARGGGLADAYEATLPAVWAEIAAMAPAQAGDLILALTLDPATLGPTDQARLRLLAVRLVLATRGRAA